MRHVFVASLIVLLAGCSTGNPLESCPPESTSDPVACWAEATRANPSNGQVRNNYGAALMNARQTEAALEQYYEAERLHPGLDTALFNIAATELRLGRPEKGIAAVDKFVAIHPEMSTGWLLKARLHSDLSKKDASSAAEHRPRSTDAYRSACAAKGDPSKAMELADIATACHFLARNLLEAGEDREAEEAFARALRVKPTHKQTLLARARYLEEKGRLDEALRDLDALDLTSKADPAVVRLREAIEAAQSTPAD